MQTKKGQLKEGTKGRPEREGGGERATPVLWSVRSSSLRNLRRNNVRGVQAQEAVVDLVNSLPAEAPKQAAVP